MVGTAQEDEGQTMLTRTQLIETYKIAREAVQRNGKKGLIAFVAMAVVALFGTLLMPQTYVSEARLFVRFGRENQVDPTASGGQMVSLYESRESEINSLIEILKSRAVLDRVVEELGLGANAERGGRSAEWKAEDQNRTKTHQMAVKQLAKDMTIAAPRKSNIITVSCKAKSPELAQRIAAK